MLKSGKTIRLHADEAETFRLITGATKAPTTVDQHDAALKHTAAYYHELAVQEKSADAELLARIAEMNLLTPLRDGTEPPEQ